MKGASVVNMTETGVVESVSGDSAVVMIVRKSACGETCGSCSGGCRLSGNKVSAVNTAGAKCGDVVTVETSTGSILYKAFIVYILPLIVFFAGYFSVLTVLGSEAISAVTAIILFAAVFFVLHILDKKNKFKTEIKVKEIKKWDIR